MLGKNNPLRIRFQLTCRAQPPLFCLLGWASKICENTTTCCCDSIKTKYDYDKSCYKKCEPNSRPCGVTWFRCRFWHEVSIWRMYLYLLTGKVAITAKIWKAKKCHFSFLLGNCGLQIVCSIWLFKLLPKGRKFDLLRCTRRHPRLEVARNKGAT